MNFLWILLASILGVAAMVLFNARLKTWTPARLESLEDAVARLDLDAVGFSAGTGILAPDGKAALVEEAGGQRIGFLRAQGDSIVIRYIRPGELRSARMAEEGALDIALDDFTFAPVRMVFPDKDDARFWADKLNAMQA